LEQKLLVNRAGNIREQVFPIHGAKVGSSGIFWGLLIG
jgi:hypothetical protein